MTEDEPKPTPEGKLIAQRREAIRPKLSQNRAAKAIGLSGNRWRHIEKGFQTVAAGIKAPVMGPADTLAKMAQLVGVTSDELIAAGRQDAADELAALETEHQHFLDNLDKQLPRLPRGAPNAPVSSEVDKALGMHPNAPGTFMPMTAAERQLLVSARNKLFRTDGDPLTDDETRLLTKFIEDDELRTLHARVDWLPRTEQLEVSSLVNNLQLAVEERWVADGFNNESEYLPDYAQPNPLPVEGGVPDQRDFPSQVPMFITKEKSNVVEAETEPDAPREAGQPQEVPSSEDGENWPDGWEPPGDQDPGVRGDEDGEQRNQL